MLGSDLKCELDIFFESLEYQSVYCTTLYYIECNRFSLQYHGIITTTDGDPFT